MTSYCSSAQCVMKGKSQKLCMPLPSWCVFAPAVCAMAIRHNTQRIPTDAMRQDQLLHQSAPLPLRWEGAWGNWSRLRFQMMDFEPLLLAWPSSKEALCRCGGHCSAQQLVYARGWVHLHATKARQHNGIPSCYLLRGSCTDDGRVCHRSAQPLVHASLRVSRVD